MCIRDSSHIADELHGGRVLLIGELGDKPKRVNDGHQLRVALYDAWHLQVASGAKGVVVRLVTVGYRFQNCRFALGGGEDEAGNRAGGHGLQRDGGGECLCVLAGPVDVDVDDTRKNRCG